MLLLFCSTFVADTFVPPQRSIGTKRSCERLFLSGRERYDSRKLRPQFPSFPFNLCTYNTVAESEVVLHFTFIICPFRGQQYLWRDLFYRNWGLLSLFLILSSAVQNRRRPLSMISGGTFCSVPSVRPFPAGPLNVPLSTVLSNVLF